MKNTIAIALTAVIAAATPGLAQDKPVMLKLSHWVPPAHPLQKAIQDWAEDVKKETRQAGVAENTLFRAKAMVGVRSRRVGFGPTGVWQWSLAEPSVIPS